MNALVAASGGAGLKLLADLGGRTVLDRVLDTVLLAELDAVALVAGAVDLGGHRVGQADETVERDPGGRDHLDLAGPVALEGGGRGGPDVVPDLAAVDDHQCGPCRQRGQEEPGGEAPGRLGRREPVRERQQLRGFEQQAGLLLGLAHRSTPHSLESVAVARLDPATREHPQAAERLALGLAQHEALEPAFAVTHEDHGGGVDHRGLAGAGEDVFHPQQDVRARRWSRHWTDPGVTAVPWRPCPPRRP